MPRYAKKKRSSPYAARRRAYKRSAYRRKAAFRRKAKRNTVSRRVGFFMPDRYVTKLRYSETIQASTQSITNMPGYFTFTLNGPFDPNYTGTGYQPFGWDQLVQFYGNQVTTGSSITAVIAPQVGSTAVSQQTTFCLLPWLNSTPPFANDPDSIRSLPYVKVSNSYVNSNVFTRSARLKSYMSVAKLAGISRERVLTNSSYSSTNVSVPSALHYWHLYCFPFQADQSQSQTYRIQVTITYYIQFFGRTLQLAS